jgi:hypothetical protein
MTIGRRAHPRLTRVQASIRVNDAHAVLRRFICLAARVECAALANAVHVSCARHSTKVFARVTLSAHAARVARAVAGCKSIQIECGAKGSRARVHARRGATAAPVVDGTRDLAVAAGHEGHGGVSHHSEREHTVREQPAQVEADGAVKVRPARRKVVHGAAEDCHVGEAQRRSASTTALT